MPAFEREGNVVSCLNGCSGSGGHTCERVPASLRHIRSVAGRYCAVGPLQPRHSSIAAAEHASTLSQTLPSVRSLSS